MFDLLLLIVVFLVGWGCGALYDALRDAFEPPNPTPHHGLYGQPYLSRWFLLRDQETDPALRSMPLRDYIALKGGRYETDV